MESKFKQQEFDFKESFLPKRTIEQKPQSSNEPATICPNCRRIVSSQHFKCPYCHYCLGCDSL